MAVFRAVPDKNIRGRVSYIGYKTNYRHGCSHGRGKTITAWELGLPSDIGCINE